MTKKSKSIKKHDDRLTVSDGVDSEASEIVFAMVGAVGVNLNLAEEALEKRLDLYGYKIEYIKVTDDILPKLFGITKRKRLSRQERRANDFDRINQMMDFGDKARLGFGNNILARGVAAEIGIRRKNLGKENPRCAYIVHSLKHPDEVRELRRIYPRGFHLIGVHAHPDFRRKHLIQERKMNENQAEELMKRDRKSDEKHGQQLVDTFHLSDFFVGWGGDDNTQSAQSTLDLGDETTTDNISGYTVNSARVAAAIDRYIDLVFGHRYRTPTFGEHAMFMAFTASLRSADLSRQVGAVVAKDGEILANGANDAPSAGGGLYWPYVDKSTHQILDSEMGRDFKRGMDSNRNEQNELIDSICEDFRSALGSGENTVAKSFQNLIASFGTESDRAKVSDDVEVILRTVLEKCGIRNLTEYGRIVHAEMEAVLSCTRQGKSTKEATIYCTTFPCHNCAKHIVASGIARVVFIEPYLKSKALDFHDDSIVIHYPHDESREEKNIEFLNKPRVKFEPFFGVGPRRFLDLFSMGLGTGIPLERKDKSGKVIPWNEKDASPRLQMHKVSYLEMEAEAASSFTAAVKSKKKQR